MEFLQSETNGLCKSPQFLVHLSVQYFIPFIRICHEFDPHNGQNFFLTKNAKNIIASASSDNKNSKNSINGPFLPNLHPFYENLSNSGLSFKSTIVRKTTSKKKSGNCQWSKNYFKWRIIVIFCHCRPNLHKLKRDKSIEKFLLSYASYKQYE